jgi:hypothetical protein
MGRRIIVTHEDWFKLPDKQLERKIELSHKIEESAFLKHHPVVWDLSSMPSQAFVEDYGFDFVDAYEMEEIKEDLIPHVH